MLAILLTSRSASPCTRACSSSAISLRERFITLCITAGEKEEKIRARKATTRLGLRGILDHLHRARVNSRFPFESSRSAAAETFHLDVSPSWVGQEARKRQPRNAQSMRLAATSQKKRPMPLR